MTAHPPEAAGSTTTRFVAHAPPCLREPFLRARGSRGLASRRFGFGIGFGEALARFLVAAFWAEGADPEDAVERRINWTTPSLGTWVELALRLAARVAQQEQAVARPLAVALWMRDPESGALAERLRELVRVRNDFAHAALGPDMTSEAAGEAYSATMVPLLRSAASALVCFDRLAVVAREADSPDTVLRFAGPESQVIRLPDDLRPALQSLPPSEAVLIDNEGRAATLAPFMCVRDRTGPHRARLVQQLHANGVRLLDPHQGAPVSAPEHWYATWWRDKRPTHGKTLVVTGALGHLCTRPDRVPSRIAGRFEVLARVAEGASATVYRARNDEGEVVAVKVLHRGLASQRDQVRRLRAELSALSRAADHPHTVRPLELVDDPALGTILVMEYVDGVDLGRLFHERACSLREASRITGQVLSALRHLHQAGVIHRDVKPSNILMDHSGNARLIDLGIARLVDRTRDTRTIDALGTPGFAAPELLTGEEPTPAADLFSVARTFAWLCGQGRGGIAEVGLPAGIQGWIRRATRPRSTDRYESASEMAEALEALGATEWNAAPVAPGDVVSRAYRVDESPRTQEPSIWRVTATELATDEAVSLIVAPARTQAARALLATLRRVRQGRLAVFDDADGLTVGVVTPQTRIDVTSAPMPASAVRAGQACGEFLGPRRTAPGTAPLRWLYAAPDHAATSGGRVLGALAELSLLVRQAGSLGPVGWYAHLDALGGLPDGWANACARMNLLLDQSRSKSIGADLVSFLRETLSMSDIGAGARRLAGFLHGFGLARLSAHAPSVLFPTTDGLGLLTSAHPRSGALHLEGSTVRPAPIPHDHLAHAIRSWCYTGIRSLMPVVRVRGDGHRWYAVDDDEQPAIVATFTDGQPRDRWGSFASELAAHHASVVASGVTDGLVWQWFARTPEGTMERADHLPWALA